MANLPLYFEQRRVGAIDVDKSGPGFLYDPDWIALPGAFPISITMPLTSERISPISSCPGPRICSRKANNCAQLDSFSEWRGATSSVCSPQSAATPRARFRLDSRGEPHQSSGGRLVSQSSLREFWTNCRASLSSSATKACRCHSRAFKQSLRSPSMTLAASASRSAALRRRTFSSQIRRAFGAAFRTKRFA